MSLRVLVACERSGIVRDAFLKRGHFAWSCDLEPSPNYSDRHIMADAKWVIYSRHIYDHWDLLICHPPCTRLSVSGAHLFSKYRQEQDSAIRFFLMFARAPIPMICIENPVGIMSTLWRKPDQIIQPWQFGHNEQKKTCLWLKGLPPLAPTKIIPPPYANLTKSGQNNLGGNANDGWDLDRAGIRAQTYTGIAEAMAEQWGRIKPDKTNMLMESLEWS